MPTLSVNDFSCLKEVIFELHPVNVIIGPQGSGKSVTTKLFYFFSDIVNVAIQAAEKGETLEQFKKYLSKQFCIWFPPAAWGDGRFNISYSAGEFYVRILRRKSQNRVSDEVSIKFSDYFTKFYEEISHGFERYRYEENESIADHFDSVLGKSYRYRELASSRIMSDLGENYLGSQTFIPAGRAFFTSIGRIVAGFEQAGSLDPVTIKFARIFANIRDRATSRHFSRRRDFDLEVRRTNFMNKLFGREIKFEDDLEFVESIDGRKIPFTALSSGQQELLPMWSLMDYFSDLDIFRGKPSRGRKLARELIYIEEPEAHLFPSAQSVLMEFLISSMASERHRRSLIITTHSAYIMSKLNVFLKAGQLSRRKKRNEKINEIVPRECWLHDNQMSAFAVDDGRLKNLIDDDGLIDGIYLDSVSEDISIEFSKLLVIENEISNG